MSEQQSVENDAGLLRLFEAVAVTLAEQRCNGLHPEDGGTCYRCREWAGAETRAMFDRFAPPRDARPAALATRVIPPGVWCGFCGCWNGHAHPDCVGATEVGEQ